MYPSNFNETGGIFVCQQVKELRRQGCEIKVVSPVPWASFPVKYLSKKWKRYSEIPKKAILDKIEVYYPRCLEFPKAFFFASSGKRMYWGIKKIVAKIYKDFRFDVIHSHIALPDGYAGMMLAKRYNKPLIVTIHGQDFQQTIYKNKKCKRNIEKVINFSRKTIVVSNKLKKIGEKELNINPEKLITISNGVNIEDIHQEKSNLTEKYKGKKIILSVSSLIKIKGIDYNLEAAARLKEKYPNLIYLIIGDGAERKTLEKLVEKLNLKNRVTFLGQLTHKKTMEYMSICDIFSLPSWKEGFGIVYLESMAHKKPVIACQKQGITDIIKNKEIGILVKPKNTNDLTNAIDFLLSHPNIGREWGKKAYGLVKKYYTWDSITSQLISLYKNILINKI